eukprot:362375-Chlamydomonas_euryale.AAC.3
MIVMGMLCQSISNTIVLVRPSVRPSNNCSVCLFRELTSDLPTSAIQNLATSPYPPTSGLHSPAITALAPSLPSSSAISPPHTPSACLTCRRRASSPLPSSLSPPACALSSSPPTHKRLASPAAGHPPRRPLQCRAHDPSWPRAQRTCRCNSQQPHSPGTVRGHKQRRTGARTGTA